MIIEMLDKYGKIDHIILVITSFYFNILIKLNNGNY